MEASTTRSNIPLILVATLLTATLSGTVTASNNYVRTACQSTLYPVLCEQSLAFYGSTVHRSPRQLASFALSVSVQRSLQAASALATQMSSGPMVTRNREESAVQDCIQTLSDSVGRLQRSGREMRRMGRYGSKRFVGKLCDVTTWVSAALTDQNACLESLSEESAEVGAVTAVMRSKILEVTRITSNALALVTRLG